MRRKRIKRCRYTGHKKVQHEQFLAEAKAVIDTQHPPLQIRDALISAELMWRWHLVDSRVVLGVTCQLDNGRTELIHPESYGRPMAPHMKDLMNRYGANECHHICERLSNTNSAVLSIMVVCREGNMVFTAEAAQLSGGKLGSWQINQFPYYEVLNLSPERLTDAECGNLFTVFERSGEPPIKVSDLIAETEDYVSRGEAIPFVAYVSGAMNLKILFDGYDCHQHKRIAAEGLMNLIRHGAERIVCVSEVWLLGESNEPEWHGVFISESTSEADIGHFAPFEGRCRVGEWQSGYGQEGGNFCDLFARAFRDVKRDDSPSETVRTPLALDENCDCELVECKPTQAELKTTDQPRHESKLADLPLDFEHVKPHLFPAIRSRSFLHNLQLEAEACPIELATIPLSEHLVEGLIYDMPATMQFVTSNNLATWGVSLREAFDVANQNLQQRKVNAETFQPHLVTVANGDGFDATRMLLLDRIRSFDFSGDPVGLPVTRNLLLLTGSEDEVGLQMMADVAENNLEEARPICWIPHRLRGNVWEEWMPPMGSKVFDRFRVLRIRYWSCRYARQKSLLDHVKSRTGAGGFVASYIVHEECDHVSSYSVWSKDLRTWLPETEFVGFFSGAIEGLVPWHRIRAIVGPMMKRTDHYPARWYVEDFPSTEQLAAMRPGPPDILGEIGAANR